MIIWVWLAGKLKSAFSAYKLIIVIALEDEEIGMQIGGVWINSLCFADNTELLVESLSELQAMINRVMEANENLGMNVNGRGAQGF